MTINRIVAFVTIILAFAISTTTHAEDDAAKQAQKEKERVAKATVEDNKEKTEKLVKEKEKADKLAKEEKEKTDQLVKNKDKQKNEEHHGGNWFTSFWIHDVGGTIGNGLKVGVNKIKRTFD
ncbi:MAG: hypothetical protein V1899_05660 [Planctomycetota bacterium]